MPTRVVYTFLFSNDFDWTKLLVGTAGPKIQSRTNFDPVYGRLYNIIYSLDNL